MTKIRITIKHHFVVRGEFNDTDTARRIAEALPLRSKANTWGKEIYFDIGLSLPQESASEFVEIGDLAYWPEGKAFCVFFGPTPASEENQIRAVSPVNVVGHLRGKFDLLHDVRDGDHVRVDREE